MDTQKKLKIGVVGGAGYTAGELLRIIMGHPMVKVDFVYSTSSAGKPLHSIHYDLLGVTDMCFTDEINPTVDVLFMCTAHGDTGNFLREHPFCEHTRIIDLSNEFRLKADSRALGRKFVYGLPEVNRTKIVKAHDIANPGCFATAIQLALAPLATAGLLKGELHVNAITGSTGAGVKPSATTHFSWREGNLSYYKPFTHQHLGEINETLTKLNGNDDFKMYFLPIRGNHTRGIFATAYTDFEGTEEDARTLYNEFYKDAPFTFVSSAKEVHLKMAVNTNKCIIGLHKYEGKLLITSVIDNLIKGASGQAIQNMNLMLGFPEDMGLNLKATAF
ncbi:MAG: N-acetyl-gamma-glutamyl-phosphate reductase [Flavobacteriales bacterium]|nr:N-acetyl-gamma-glutamyl-phosphate reductase [Flavobacteriales bacterium]